MDCPLKKYMPPKSRTELYSELTSIIIGKNMTPIKEAMVKRYRVGEVSKLSQEQLSDWVTFCKKEFASAS